MIDIKGVPPEASGDLRRVVTDKFGDYDLTSGAQNGWTLTMKPSVATDTRKKAVQQAIETIRNRIDQLGVSEPVIQEHGLGDYQILVQLPGVDDPARVKEIMQSTAMLEIRQAVNGPYASEQAAMQANNGVLPPDTRADEGHQRRARSGPGCRYRGLLADQPDRGGQRQRSALGRLRIRMRMAGQTLTSP